MAELNRFGLSRDVPDPIKREVRQRDGFGCVCCGKAIYDYDHFDPEFKDAREHLATGIILLCKSCHGKKGTFLSLDTIAKAAAAPKAKQKGFSFEGFDVGLDHPEIVIGRLTTQRVERVIDIMGEEIFSVHPPFETGGPFNLTARITDRSGADVLHIVDNEWRVPSSNWDVEVVKARITVRRGSGDIALRLRSEPGKRIVVERLDLEYRGTRIIADENKPIDILSSGGARIVGDNVHITGAKAAIHVTEAGVGLGYGGGTSRASSGFLQAGPSMPVMAPVHSDQRYQVEPPKGMTAAELGDYLRWFQQNRNKR